jgi:signal transduction histidine kinase
LPSTFQPTVTVLNSAVFFNTLLAVDKSRSKKMGGTGLGLAIVKHITTAHNAETTPHRE